MCQGPSLLIWSRDVYQFCDTCRNLYFRTRTIVEAILHQCWDMRNVRIYDDLCISSFSSVRRVLLCPTWRSHAPIPNQRMNPKATHSLSRVHSPLQYSAGHDCNNFDPRAVQNGVRPARFQHVQLSVVRWYFETILRNFTLWSYSFG